MDKEKPKEIDYFAGAKFDCLPSVSSLPTPPSEWTIPVLRSQSQPSSPVTTGVRIDLNSLFLTPQVKKASAIERDYREADLKKQREIDTHPKTVIDVEMAKTSHVSSQGYVKNRNSRNGQETSSKVESKPIDITRRRISSTQPKQLYPHLTEHLKLSMREVEKSHVKREAFQSRFVSILIMSFPYTSINICIVCNVQSQK
ncbi:unnamed protein product [Allacma fusca]|uniref:Uncharacterized protein n=1 Tax=Allacma fusca TaxID=39272 RepID=A0A8J2JBR3_9HEXA|nr:unnamed protein product [Allacma fusca]